MPYQELHHQAQQQLGISPRLAHSVRLLQMSSLDFAQELRTAATSNPFLEVDDEPEDAEAEPAAEEGDDAEPERAETFDEYDSWLGADRSPESSDAGDFAAFEQRAVEASLAVHLHAQLGLLQLPARDATLARAVIDCIDDDGYLRVPLDDLVDVLALDPPVEDDELRIALCRVQSLEPRGVGARSVAECLALQLKPLDTDAEERRLALAMTSLSLEVLARATPAGLATELRCPVEAAASALACIRRLDPRPGWRFGAADTRFIVPDITVRRARGRWSASLNEAVMPKVRLHCVYAEIFERQERGRHRAMAEQLRDARWTLRNVELRFATILGVAQAIVERQQAFFDHGPLALKPLCLREIADAVGVHESTVSRVTNGKYAATPLGRFEFKYFFSRGMTSASGASVTGESIRAEMLRMISAETASRPMSDATIQASLARQGVEITRRTVTKYRMLLRIGSARHRRSAA